MYFPFQYFFKVHKYDCMMFIWDHLQKLTLTKIIHHRKRDVFQTFLFGFVNLHTERLMSMCQS
jgi:hypothetical protein